MNVKIFLVRLFSVAAMASTFSLSAAHENQDIKTPNMLASVQNGFTAIHNPAESDKNISKEQNNLEDLDELVKDYLIITEKYKQRAEKGDFRQSEKGDFRQSMCKQVESQDLDEFPQLAIKTSRELLLKLVSVGQVDEKKAKEKRVYFIKGAKRIEENIDKARTECIRNFSI